MESRLARDRINTEKMIFQIQIDFFSTKKKNCKKKPRLSRLFSISQKKSCFAGAEKKSIVEGNSRYRDDLLDDSE